MKLAGTERMQWFPACVAFTLSAKKSPTNRIWPPLGDWPLRPNHVRYRNVWYLVGKIIHRAIFSQKLKFLPWSSDALLAIKVPAGEKDPPRGFKGQKSPGPIGLMVKKFFISWNMFSRKPRNRHGQTYGGKESHYSRLRLMQTLRESRLQ